MKKLILILFALFSLNSFAQSSSEGENEPQWEMKTYCMVLLKKGPNRDHPKEEVAKIQEQHLAHISKLHKEGKVVMAGPFLDDWEAKGILIFNMENMDEVRKLAKEDPAVKAGRLIVEVHQWYAAKGSALP